MKRFLVVSLTVLLMNCSSRMDNFPMQKRYWTPEDYDQVLTEIRYRTPDGDKFPTMNDPELGQVFRKLVDRENISVVVEDEALGLKHRGEFASDMFSEVRDLVETYSFMDREDNFIYDLELVEVLKFSLFLQRHYFFLGNQEVIRESDDAESYAVQNILRSNERTVVSNYNLYLDYVNREHSFSEEAIKEYADGIDTFFKELMRTFPKADFNPTRTKATAMLKKAKSDVLKSSLNNLIKDIDDHSREGTTATE